MVRIILDAMGSDSHPHPEIGAALEVSQTLEVDLTLVGDENQIRKIMAADFPPGSDLKIIHAPEVVEMTDKPAENSRRKAQNSMAIGMDLIKTGEADAFITAGNTGAAMANALFRLGRIRGVKRPGLTGVFPVRNSHTVVLDIGANSECKPLYLHQFAIMGSIYAHQVLGVNQPRLGLLSNGEEAGKGNLLVQETFPLLESSGLNFIGNVESKELFGGQADVVVTDGFTGNILLKTSEAAAALLVDILREELTASTRTKLGALLARPAFGAMRKLLDPSETGAAPLLGINGLVFIGHGRSDSRALFNAVRVAKQAVTTEVLPRIRDEIRAQTQRTR